MAEVHPDRPAVMGDWLKEGSICLIYGLRGCGKSTFAMGLAEAAANGCEFLRPEWKPSRRYRVLYMDSEMGLEGMQRKFRQVDSACKVSISKETKISLLCPDHMGGSAWNLSDYTHQKTITELMMLNGHDLLIIDNLLGFSGPLFRGDDEMSVWKRLEDWIIPLRNLGRTVVIIHHSSKSGDQYGTIKKENPCDTVVRLEPVKDEWVNGLSIDWHFTKGRWIYGESQKSQRVTYETLPDGRQQWGCCPLDDSNRIVSTRLFKQGWAKGDIAKALKISESEVSVILKGGSLSPTPPPPVKILPNAMDNDWEYDT